MWDGFPLGRHWSQELDDEKDPVRGTREGCAGLSVRGAEKTGMNVTAGPEGGAGKSGQS